MPVDTLRPLFAALLVALGGAAAAADTPSPPPPAAGPAAVDPLATVRSHIEARQWTRAIDELRRVNATGSADWNNLMGYAQRKQAKPDLDAAQRFYDTALQINPQHQGALEYSGELALMKGDLATAEVRLAALSKLCSTPCEPLDDLQKAVAKFKATGKI
jgi:Flp pilus assembly protein TadD